MEKIRPHLWFDKEAREAAELYTSVFENSRIKSSMVLHHTPSGSVDVVTIELAGQEFQLISAGPMFKFTPAISFMVACKTKEEVDAVWSKLANGGKVLMELGEYPFSERYGWTEDRYGLSWQIAHFGDYPVAQKITPSFLFAGDVAGKAEDAMRHYTSIFRNSSVGEIHRYGADEQPDQEGTVKFGTFTLEGQHFNAMDSAHSHGFTFNEAVSLLVHCDTQDEIDYYWDRLTAVPESEVCGWLKDRYGVSWQIVPTLLDEVMASGDQQKIARATEAFLKMRKFDLAALESAVEGK